jgi:hypothetical protein
MRPSYSFVGNSVTMIPRTTSPARASSTTGLWPHSGANGWWPGAVAERRYRLRNIPCNVFGVSEHDIVFADEVRGMMEFRGVSLRGGHSTYRLLKARGLDAAVFQRHWEGLKELGCSSEGDGARLVAVDVPPHADMRAVHALLFAGADAGVWEWEEGHSSSPDGRGD